MERFRLIAVAVTLSALAGYVIGRASGGAHASAAVARKVLYYVDPMHPSYRSAHPGTAPDCGMDLEPVYEGQAEASSSSLPAGSIALNEARQQLIGFRTVAASKNSGMRQIRLTGRVVPDESRLYRLSAGMDGWVQSLGDNAPGAYVRKGEVLASLYSPEVRVAETNYLGFLSGVERLKQGSGANDLRLLENSAQINTEELRLLGMGQEQIEQLGKARRVTSSLDLVAPADGIVLARGISRSQRFERGAELYRVADLHRVWIVASAHGADESIPPGAKVKITSPQLGKTFTATVSSSEPLFDDASRTLKIRLEAENPEMLLRPDMFVDLDFDSSMGNSISIPADAVLEHGTGHTVFVETRQGIFEPRNVAISGNAGDNVLISSGLKEGEKVVCAGAFLLDSESRLRRGVEKTVDQPAQKRAGTIQTASAREQRDPVCGMPVKAMNYTLQHSGKTLTFCSESCRHKFEQDPDRYLNAMTASSTHAPAGEHD